MTTLQISLPEPLREFVERQVAEGGYPSPSDYVQSLLREVQKRKAKEQVEAMLLDGLNSGEPIEVTAAYWEEKRRQLDQRHGKAAES